MEGPERLPDIVRQFDRLSGVLPRVKWFTDAERARGLLAFARLVPGERVVEVGCGPGFVLEHVAQVAGRAVGLDPSPRMLREARTRAGPAHAVRGVVEHLPFRDGAFDLAYSRSVLHHARDPGAMLRETARVVRRGGRVVLNDSIASEIPKWARNHNAVERLRDPSHGRMVPSGELLGLFEAAGLHVVDIHQRLYARSLEEWLDITSPPPGARAEILRRFEAWVAKDGSGLNVRRQDGRIRFDHTQWTVLGHRP